MKRHLAGSIPANWPTRPFVRVFASHLAGYEQAHLLSNRSVTVAYTGHKSRERGLRAAKRRHSPPPLSCSIKTGCSFRLSPALPDFVNSLFCCWFTRTLTRIVAGGGVGAPEVTSSREGSHPVRASHRDAGSAGSKPALSVSAGLLCVAALTVTVGALRSHH